MDIIIGTSLSLSLISMYYVFGSLCALKMGMEWFRLCALNMGMGIFCVFVH